ncbi:hypothetical protein VQH23_10585 [Pararoseomonas sp. SCSIO 73927]|uniref:hypothetical protein n=1 Tax=Pararoseomonas sp. SCSIO 73927 TaxID=3114537 RepID=UPI0030D33485
MAPARGADHAEPGARSRPFFLNSVSHPAKLVVAAVERGLAGICGVSSLTGVVRGDIPARMLGLPMP